MEKKQAYNRLYRWLRWPMFVIAGLFLLVMLVRLSLLTGPVQQWAKKQMIRLADQQLNVDLDINTLSGDLWKEVILTGIVLSDKDTVASADTLYLKYNLLSYFGPVFQIDELQLSHPFLKLRQRGKQWNVSNWIKEADQPARQDTAGFPLQISHFALRQGQIDAGIPDIPKDSVMRVENLDIAGGLSLYEEDFQLSIEELSFRLEETKLNAPLALQTRARASGHTLSLEQLVIATGNTLIQSSGRVNTRDSTASFSVQAEPLGWADLAAYVSKMPVRHNLNVDLDLSGNLEHFNIGLQAAADGIRGLETAMDIRWDSTITVTGLRLQAKELDLNTFLGDSTMPLVSNLQISADGKVPISNYQQSDLQGKLSVGGISLPMYELDGVNGSVSLTSGKVMADIQIQKQNQQVLADLTVDDIWASQPYTSLSIYAGPINPASWFQNPDVKGNVSLEARLEGEGFYPDTSLWAYSIRAWDSRVAEQKIGQVRLVGQVSGDYINNRTTLRIDKSKAELEAEIWDLQTVPRFTYRLTTREFNLSELKATQDLTTAITASVWGEGQGTSLENLRLSSSVRIDSSSFNDEYIDRFMAVVNVEDTVAAVTEATLQSTIADGILEGSMHLLRWYDPDNELNLSFYFKDLSVWEPLADVEELRGEGTVEGKLHPSGDKELEFTGDINFQDVNYNNQFLADQVEGSVEARVLKHPEYTLDLQLSAPVFSSVRLQDLELKTSGKVAEERTAGDFRLVFNSSSGEGEIIHAGTYRTSDDTAVIRTNRYELTTSLRTLMLKHPFSVRIQGSSVTMDTMRLASADGAVLELSAAYVDSLNQRGYLKGNNLNLTIIQELLLGESYVDGILSGQLRANRSGTAVKAMGDLLVSGLEYQKTQFDTLRLDLDISDAMLNGGLEAIYQKRKLIEGELHVPFQLKNPAELSEAFFKRPVAGYLQVNAVRLGRFKKILDQLGLTDTEGTLRVNSTLEGTAGSPEFYSSLSLKNATLSGVPVDSVIAGLNYIHDDSQLILDASVNSMKQHMASVDAKIPFYINLKSFDINLPDATDSITVNVETNEFDLAAVNDFVDRRIIRDVTGRLNGHIRISGRTDDLKARGEMNLEGGSFSSRQAGITVDNIRSTVLFEPDQILLEEFRAESGRGSMNAEGTMELVGLQPGEMQLNIGAESFRAANTSNYNATIDTDARLTGTFNRPVVAGELSFISGFIEMDNFGEKSVESVELDDSVAAAMTDTVSVYDSLSLDMDVSFNRRFFVRNRQNLELEVELEGQVDLQKEKGEELQVFGTLSAANGYAKPLGKRFELEEGAVTFFGEPTNPELNVRTLYEPPQPEEEILIWYLIKGTVESPQFAYESQPPMGLENIISYTLFGQPFYALDSWKQAVASSGSNTTVADMAMEVLLDRVETLATQRLGIDVVRIENTRVGNENGTAITTGWYLSPRVFFAIQNIVTGSSPDTSFLLEYLLKENLKLSVSQGNDTREGIDLKWNFDY